MKILHIGYNDNSGGASEIMIQLAKYLNKENDYNSEVAVLNKTIKSADFIHQVGSKFIVDDEEEQQKIINSNRSSITNTFFSHTKTYRKEVVSFILNNKFDILHLHWVEKYISLELLKDLYDLNIPIVWSLHDERIYTAGCHCTFGCEEFMYDCKNCIQLNNDKFSTMKEFQRRFDILSKLDIQYIAPSEWIYKQAKKSTILKDKEVDIINHGVDASIFEFQKQNNQNQLHLLFLAANLDAKHKNLEDFLKILNYIDDKLSNMITVHLVGNSVNKLDYNFKKINLLHSPFIKSKKKLIQIYQQSHIFINTTLCESFSLVTVEAMACGCVPMTYLTGGISDIVDDNVAWIYERGNYIEMAEQILALSSNRKQIDEKAIAGRNKAVVSFAIDNMVNNYKEKYQILNKKKIDNLQNSIVSVVTVTFNAEKDIENTIKSIINQTYFHAIEYIIVDGGSTDRTIDIIKKYKDYIDFFISEPDNGVYDAMNKAIDIATGTWINFMNAGDQFYDNLVIENFIRKARISSDLVYGDVNVIGEGINRIVKADLENRIFKVTPFCHQSLFVKTVLMKEKKFNTTYIVLADYDFIVNSYVRNKKFQNLDFTVSKYQLGGMSRHNVHIMHTEGVHILMKLQKQYKNIVLEDSNFYAGILRYVGDTYSLTIQDEIKKLTEISFKINPIKKYKQYKRLLNAYHHNKK